MTSKISIDSRELLQKISNGEAAAGIDFGNAIVRELAAFRLTAMDSEPVAWSNGCNKSIPAALRYLAENPRPIGGESSFNTAHLYQLAREIELMAEAPLYRHAQPTRETEREPIAWLNDAYLARGVVDGEAGSEDAGPGYIPVYREAGPQPVPVVTFYRDGIEAAAKWIDQQRKAYDSEHGWSDPDTGAFEFGNDAQREYSSTLEELAEGIRALHPNAGNSPVIPDGWKLVPVEPTEEMNKAGWAAMNEHDAINPTYRAMLAAAPQEAK